MSRIRYKFSHQANGFYYWYSDRPVDPGGSRYAMYSCPVWLFWKVPDA